MSDRERANLLRDAVCAILSATGAVPHEIPRIAKEALDRDNVLLGYASRIDDAMHNKEISEWIYQLDRISPKGLRQAEHMAVSDVTRYLYGRLADLSAPSDDEQVK